MADLYGCRVQTICQTEGPALGAAILAGVGCGIYESVPAACKKLIAKDSSTSPDLQRELVYAEYHRLYDGLYNALREPYRELAKL